MGVLHAHISPVPAPPPPPAVCAGHSVLVAALYRVATSNRDGATRKHIWLTLGNNIMYICTYVCTSP